MIICEKAEIEKIKEIEESRSNKYQGFVYIIDYGDCVKIGCSRKPYQRLKDLEKHSSQVFCRKKNRWDRIIQYSF